MSLGFEKLPRRFCICCWNLPTRRLYRRWRRSRSSTRVLLYLRWSLSSRCRRPLFFFVVVVVVRALLKSSPRPSFCFCALYPHPKRRPMGKDFYALCESKFTLLSLSLLRALLHAQTSLSGDDDTVRACACVYYISPQLFFSSNVVLLWRRRRRIRRRGTERTNRFFQQRACVALFAILSWKYSRRVEKDGWFRGSNLFSENSWENSENSENDWKKKRPADLKFGRCFFFFFLSFWV